MCGVKLVSDHTTGALDALARNPVLRSPCSTWNFRHTGPSPRQLGGLLVNQTPTMPVSAS
jgi:hypothetical protein